MPLPANPRLEHLRKQAKALLHAHSAGEAQAVAAVRQYYPDAPHPLQLAGAQLVIARQHEFPSWRAMKEQVEVLEGLTRLPKGEPTSDEPAADRFLRLACLHYGADHRARFAQARELIGVAGESIWTAAAAGDAVAIERFLDADPALVRREGGPHRWTPLLYAAYSRAADTFDAGRVLLARGANPNDGYLWDGEFVFTALTGVFGEGEAGPVNQPRHPRSIEFASMLLDAGAYPNDSQAMYNRQFTADDDWLELLLSRGFGKPATNPWAPLLGDSWRGWGVDRPQNLVRYLLRSAAQLNFAHRVALLLDHLTEPLDPADPNHPAAVAIRAGNAEIVDLLQSRGIRTASDSRVDECILAMSRGDRVAVEAMRDVHPQVIAASPGLLHAAATSGNAALAELAIDVGFEVNGSSNRTPLHEAAWRGSLDVVRILVARGADTSISDGEHNGRPLDWAEYAGQAEVADFLRPLTP